MVCRAARLGPGGAVRPWWHVYAHGQDLLFRGDARKIQHRALSGLAVERGVHVHQPEVLRESSGQFLGPAVVFVPIAAQSLLAVLGIVLGKGARPERVVVPAVRRLPGAMVDGQEVGQSSVGDAGPRKVQ